MIPESEAIQHRVLHQIVPSPVEKKKLQNVIKQLLKKINQEIPKYQEKIKPVLVGSTAKDTYLRNKLDIDIFLLFSQTIPDQKLESIGLEIGHQILEEHEECYAQHPYTRGVFKGYQVEIVPCYQVQNAAEKQSAVDRTPLHTTFIQKHLKEQQKNEVRLFKQFLQGIACYGAEAEIEGFNGYLCELLILRFGSFHQVISDAAHWKPGIRLRLQNGTIDHSPVFDTPLVFIDPVDPDRNVASALVLKKFELYVTACEAYLKKPRMSFFFPKPLEPWSLTKIKKYLKDRHIVGVSFKNPNIIPENLYPQLRKATRTLSETAITYGFEIVDATYYVTEKTIGVVLFPLQEILSTSMVHMGPPAHLKKHAQDFLDKWHQHPRVVKPPYIYNERWYVKIKREFTSLEDLLTHLVPELSLGKHMSGKTVDKFSIKKGVELITESLQYFWTQYLDTRYPWER